jgi:hypothetical protein
MCGCWQAQQVYYVVYFNDLERESTKGEIVGKILALQASADLRNVHWCSPYEIQNC